MAGDVLLGKEKIQKMLLARLTETLVMWLSDEQEFWGALEDNSVPLKPLGLQQVFYIYINIYIIEHFYVQILSSKILLGLKLYPAQS